jgi:hypothetical protein
METILKPEIIHAGNQTVIQETDVPCVKPYGIPDVRILIIDVSDGLIDTRRRTSHKA